MLQFNITHLYRREALLDCFDRISTTQVELHDTPLLIFFDEINAPLDGEEVYGSFLSPLEEGTYVRAEKSFHIGPAVWLFAGTRFEATKPKAVDFQSRLTQGIVPLGTLDEDQEGDSGRGRTGKATGSREGTRCAMFG